MPEITLNGYQCNRCQHTWIPREEGEKPRVCPRCKSPYWDTARKIKPKKDVNWKERKRGR